MSDPILIPVTPEFEKKLTDDWSEPVQVRIENGAFVARSVKAVFVAGRELVRGEEPS